MAENAGVRLTIRAWATILGLLFAVVLVPFFVFGHASNERLDGWLQSDGSTAAVAIVIVVALTIDVFLPVPSSVVSTASGALLGVWFGAIVSTVGMTLGCIVGYWAGSRFGPPFVTRLVDQRDLRSLQGQFRQRANWALAVCRPVPVLAEASTLLAGLSAIPVARFVLITTSANAGISMVYAVAGATARHGPSLAVLTFVASCALPGIAILVTRNARTVE